MAKNDFDFDFDFESDYSSDSEAVYNSEFNDADLDFSEFDANDLGIDLEEADEARNDYGEFDLDDLDLGDMTETYSESFEEDFDEKHASEQEFDQEMDPEADFDEELPEEDDVPEDEFGMDFDDDGFGDEPEFEEDDELMDFSRRTSFFGQPEQEVPYYEQPAYEEPAYEAPVQDQEQSDYEQETVTEQTENPEMDAADASELKRNSLRRRQERKEKKDSAQRKEREPIKLTMPPFLIKLWKLYVPTKEMIDPQPDPNNPRRRRRKSKVQIFKEAYLPAILACLTLVLMLSFVIGSIGNAIQRKKIDDEAARESSISAANQAELIKSEAETLLDAAALQAQGYDYDGAVTTLNSFSGNINDYPEMVAALSDYMNARDTLVEFNSPSTIPNLSFHVLVADPARAYADKDYGGLYNRNFVTTDEFQRILEQLYKNDYVLVDFDSFVSGNTDLEGNTNFFSVPIKLPEGKKPVMITETMVNYFAYMIDGNNDGVADAGGDGFASKLVVDANGDIKAEYVDINSQTQIGNYDLVPILEEFIKQHPDFSYRGARATLAVTGHEGVFGWRCNTTYIAAVGQAYYDEQVLGAKEVVNALRNKGYRIACYSYENKDYGQDNANQIQADLTKWNDQITPILGQVDTIVFAKESDIGDYTGPKFNVLFTSGFRYMITDGDQPYAEVNNTYVRQTRLMVTGNTMAWKSAQFTNLSLFDPNIVLDMVSRKQVPN